MDVYKGATLLQIQKAGLLPRTLCGRGMLQSKNQNYLGLSLVSLITIYRHPLSLT